MNISGTDYYIIFIQAGSNCNCIVPSNEMQSCNNQYTVSRNGIILSWQQIHNQYNQQIPNDQNNNHDCNNNDATTPLDSNTFLQMLPRGAYTTCRTVKGGSRIYQFNHHVKRLADSAKSVWNDVIGSASAAYEHYSCVIDSADDDEVGVNNDQDRATSIIFNRDRMLDGINQIDITNVAWEHDTILKCIQSTLKEFCSRFGLQQISDGSIIDSVGGSSTPRKSEVDVIDDNVHVEKIEFKITLLATWETTNTPSQDIDEPLASADAPTVSPPLYQSVLYCHVGLLKPKIFSTPTSPSVVNKSPYIRVLIRGHGRENALAKDSKWVLEREKLTKPSTIINERGGDDNDNGNTTIENTLALQEFEEVILINDKGELLEGTQTNFYVVSADQSTVITANEGILHGSVRDSVLRACQHHNIPVELRPPKLLDLRCASGVFISSTSRWVMPVHEVYLGDLLSLQNGNEVEGSGIERKKNKDGVRSYVYGHCGTTDNIRQWVLEDVESHSTAIFIEGLQ